MEVFFSGPSSAGTLASGTFVPTLTAITHASGETLVSARYMRMGGIVVMNVEFDVTADGGGDCVTDVSLPIPSNFAALSDGSGVAVASPLTGANVQAESTTHKARVPLVAAAANTYNVHFEFMYSIV